MLIIINTTRLTSARLILVWIYFRGCKFCHVLRGFISTDDKMFIVLPGVNFMFATYVIFRCIVKIMGKRQIFATLLKIVSVQVTLIGNLKF